MFIRLTWVCDCIPGDCNGRETVGATFGEDVFVVVILVNRGTETVGDLGPVVGVVVLVVVLDNGVDDDEETGGGFG